MKYLSKIYFVVLVWVFSLIAMAEPELECIIATADLAVNFIVREHEDCVELQCFIGEAETSEEAIELCRVVGEKWNICYWNPEQSSTEETVILEIGKHYKFDVILKQCEI